jgi:hypothetical protein
MPLGTVVVSALGLIPLRLVPLAESLLAESFACAETAPNRIMPQLAAIRKVFTVAMLISPSRVFQIYRVDTVNVETIAPALRQYMKMASNFRSIFVVFV